MPRSLAPHDPHRAGLGAFTVVLLTCVVAPPLVRGAAEAGEINDGGGCNGGRSVPVDDEDSDTTNGEASSTSETGEMTTTTVDGGQAMMDHSSSSSGTIQPKTTVKPGSCGDGAQDAGESILLAQNRS